jgi:arylsulfatase A-like enzyme
MNENRRNVLMVISDQHIARCMGCEGHPQAITPTMDRLAEQGVRFTNAYAANPICTPSRVSVLSGQYVHNHGYFGLSGPQPGRHGTRPLPSVFGHFKEAGYCTAGIGKLHMPDDPRNWLEHDLDLYADCYWSKDKSRHTRFFDHLRRHGLLEKEDSIELPEFPGRQQHEGRPSELPYEHSVEGWCAREAMHFIDGCGDDPFFMQVSLPRPHQCYTPDQRFWEMYPEDLELPETYRDEPSRRPPHFQLMVEQYRAQGDAAGLLEPKGLDHLSRRVWRAYLACITQCDHALGEMMDHLEKRGLAENTIVLYVSDHGAYSTSFGVPEKAPGICSEHVCRIPMIWHAPGVTPAGHVCDQFAHHVDLAPTLCALAGLEPMDTADGFDLTGLLRGGDEAVRDVCVTEHAWSKSLRWKNWRFVHYQREMFDEDVGELYDIAADPNERNNLYDDPQHQGVVAECRRLLLEWHIGVHRVVTSHPQPKTEGGTPVHPVAGDGRCGNRYSPRAKLGGAHAVNYT